MRDSVQAPLEGATTRLPKLGPRGEGWVVIQAAFLVSILAAGLLTGPDLSYGRATAFRAIAGALIVVGLIVGALGIRALRRAMTGSSYRCASARCQSRAFSSPMP